MTSGFFGFTKEELDPEQEKAIKKQLKVVMIRRMKSELPPKWNGEPRFPKRVVKAVEVDYSEEEKMAHHLLQSYGKSLQKKELKSSERYATEFVLKYTHHG